jgi:hypothetical protein
VRFAGHNEAREAFVLSIAGVTAIMLIAILILLILFQAVGCPQIAQDKKGLRPAPRVFK